MKAVIVDGLRTPFLKVGTVKNNNAVRMSYVPTQILLYKYSGLRQEINYVIGANIGNQILAPDGSNLARVIGINNNLPLSVGAWTVNSNCSSGLHAVVEAAKLIELGMANCVLVVGVEVMSDFKLKTMPHQPLWMLETGLTDPGLGLKMNQIAEKIAKEFGISREEQDLFALESQKRASIAQRSRRLAKEIVFFEGLGDDNGIRHNQLLSKLNQLKSLEPDGTITPGNSSQLTDGACVLIVTSADFAKTNGLPIVAQIEARESVLVGCNPLLMGLGPVYAIHKLLHQSKYAWSDFEVLETNEAFAAVVLAQGRLLACEKYAKKFNLPGRIGELDWSKTNVNGGAIAIGHPLSASGARLVLTCLREMELRNKSLGLVTLCIGGGQGEALILHR